MLDLTGTSDLGDPQIARLVLEGLPRGLMRPRYVPRRIASTRALTSPGYATMKAGPAPVPFLSPAGIPFSGATGAAGGVIYESVRNASAAAAAPTQQNEYLVGIVLEGGGANGAGAWLFQYDGTHQAVFPVGASGLDATGAIGPSTEMFYPLNYGPIGTNIPAAVQTYSGGLAAVRFIFSNRPNPAGYRISAFTGVFVTGTESGTGGTSKTYSIPGALGKPTGIVGLASIATGTATGVPIAEIDFPAIGNYGSFAVPASLGRGDDRYKLWAVPDYDPAASFSLTHKAISLGAATTIQIAGSLYYRQALQRTAQA